jgi:hypothetical protein
MASLRESDAEDSLNSALLGILLRRIRFSPNEKCSNSNNGDTPSRSWKPNGQSQKREIIFYAARVDPYLAWILKNLA